MTSAEKYEYWLVHDFMNDVLNTVTEEFATDIFHRTKEAFVWLQTLKP
jgi:hypothetical protein